MAKTYEKLRKANPCHLSHNPPVVQGVSKKVRCRKLQYFINSAIYQRYILRLGNYKFYLGVCKVSIQYVKGNSSYGREKNDR